jgi:chemotaxis protein MotA
MNLSIILGVALGLVLLSFGILYSGGSLFQFWDFSSALITFGGTISSLLVAFPVKKVLQMIQLVKIAIFPQKYDYEELIIDIISFSEKARREGLLALEDSLAEVEDPFMRKGLQLIVDGTDPALVRNILEIEIEQMMSRHDDNKRMFDEAAQYAPAFGMIGTLMGLVMMLVNLQDKSTIGPYLAVAIITTFYGAVANYLVFSPIGTRLDLMTGEEALLKQIIIAGVMSVHSGENPRITRDKLVSFLPASLKDTIAEKVGE